MAISFIKLSRKFLSWEWYDDCTMVKLFLHLFFKANYERAKWHGIFIERGSLITSYRHLSMETGMSTGKLRVCMKRLEECGEISIRPTNKYSYITMLKYDEWQGNEVFHAPTTKHIEIKKNNHISAKKKKDESSDDTYAKLIKNPQWQKKRLKILERDGFKCVKCGCNEKSLHVHHLYYKKGIMPWEYPDDALVTLCERCHEEAHKNNEK